MLSLQARQAARNPAVLQSIYFFSSVSLYFYVRLFRADPVLLIFPPISLTAPLTHTIWHTISEIFGFWVFYCFVLGGEAPGVTPSSIPSTAQLSPME